MREILFRGKITQDKWAYGFYENVKLEEEGIIHYVDGKIVSSKTIGQFTGLTDKNGKKIFEGDIVKIRRAYLNAGYEEDCFYKVAWHKYWNGWALINIKDTQSCYLDNVIKGEVIGNIHDNPEFLEKFK